METDLKTQMILNLTQFIDKTEMFGLLAYHTVFRGQTVRRNLIPTIARADPTKDTTEEERGLLDQLLRMGVTRIPHPNSDPWDLLILAQHFGMKTRLLDWTSNPLAALWFACSGEDEGDAYVYALEADDHMRPKVFEADPFEQPQTIVIQPRLGNERIVAQTGWFTLHQYSKKIKKFVSLENNVKTKGNLSEFVIPKKKRPEILLSLDRCGINQSTLFPDLEGLCRYLNWKHKVNPELLPRL